MCEMIPRMEYLEIMEGLRSVAAEGAGDTESGGAEEREGDQ